VRTTVDLPEDLHRRATALARDTKRTFSQTVSDLVRKGLDGAGADVTVTEDPDTGLPLVHLGRVITSDEVRELEDDML
jgi:predicted transcriptional regulator